GGLGVAELARIHAPIGLNLVGKPPAEIALAVLADILGIRNGIPRERPRWSPSARRCARPWLPGRGAGSAAPSVWRSG
ncbi:XdhC family protein, partial [Pseudomonas aeruginosa]|uniref:XdhC family protein n=1 Tax=Pseudomonas aeruginosa TaxID=287 RepID=UPI0024AF2BAA